ncbi:hypothetical protein DPMN_004129 [Dreissena polymorpha]|uniref:Uncharacterized protein n=1 Tax=Dreissena polymorpha TaxID=45954 RepID=A0A9D4MQR0_DREPO|nr:hypothetical protein DPMN_004129 [Dreissena polymorpha]
MVARPLIWIVSVLLTVSMAGGQSDAEWLSWKSLNRRNYSSFTSELVHGHIGEGTIVW